MSITYIILLIHTFPFSVFCGIYVVYCSSLVTFGPGSHTRKYILCCIHSNNLRQNWIINSSVQNYNFHIILFEINDFHSWCFMHIINSVDIYSIFRRITHEFCHKSLMKHSFQRVGFAWIPYHNNLNPRRKKTETPI